MNWKISLSVVLCCLVLGTCASKESKPREKRTIRLILNGIAGQFGFQVVPTTQAPPASSSPMPVKAKQMAMPAMMMPAPQNPLQAIFQLSAPASAQPASTAAPPPPSQDANVFKFGPIQIPIPGAPMKKAAKKPVAKQIPISFEETDGPERFVFPKYYDSDVGYKSYKFDINQLENAQNPYKNALPEFEYYSPKSKVAEKNFFEFQDMKDLKYPGTTKPWEFEFVERLPEPEKIDIKQYENYFQKEQEPAKHDHIYYQHYEKAPEQHEIKQYPEYYQHYEEAPEHHTKVASSAEVQSEPQFYYQSQPIKHEAIISKQEKYAPEQQYHHPAPAKSHSNSGAQSVIRLHTQKEAMVTYHN